MSNLTITERDGVLMVDSRLVAQDLGIEHRALLQTLDKHIKKIEAAFGAVAFEMREFKTKQGNSSTEKIAWLTEEQSTLLMSFSRNTPRVVDCKVALVQAFSKAKQAIKELNHHAQAQDQEIERMKLELELLRAKQHYQDSGHAIALSTSPAMLQWLRGEAPPPVKVEYRERFVDARGREIGSSSGRSLTQLITDTGLNPKSTKDRATVKHILKCHGFDYDQLQQWTTASYLRSYPVLSDGLYEQALKTVLSEVTTGDTQPNLFVHSLQQSSLTPGTQPHSLEGQEP